jgi:hypothetical protein
MKNETPTQATLIPTGTRVRSHDFPCRPGGMDVEGETACYLTGTVVGILPQGHPLRVVDGSGTPLWVRYPDADRYIIVPESRTWCGETEPADPGRLVFPPTNDSPTTFGRITMGVVPVEVDE